MALKLVRDKLGSEDSTVQDRKEYLEFLRSDAELLFSKMFKSKNQIELYETMADFDEIYQCLKGQLLTTGSELGTKARHMKQHSVAKERAEQLGGYFNGMLA